MCGIAGLMYFDGERRVDPAVLDRMTDVLAHRGPDGRGTHIDGPVGLGHRRLSIIDLSDDGQQPMTNEDGSVWVVLNGEIYNYQALRDELIAKGHTFKSRTDTEVLVHLYEEHGEDLVDRLRGMFAFCIYDVQARRLVLARDRFGQKPLCYRLTHEGLWFGSETKAIVADPAVPREVDFNAVHDFLTYIYVPAPRTGFVGIQKLPPGHVLTVEADGRSRLRKYWQLHMTPKRTAPVGPREEQQLLDELLGLMDEAVALRLMSDVPLGAFLSGGVDSSAIVASMVAANGGSGAGVKTFSIGFDVPAWDETEHARRVARHLGTDHEELRLAPDSAVALERIAWHHGEPFADSSCLPTFAVSALARRKVTVALSGDGGDELFMGYSRYQGTWLEEWTREQSPGLQRVLRSRPLLAVLARMNLKDRLGTQMAHNRYYDGVGLADLYATRLESFSPELKASIYSERGRSDARGRDSRQIVARKIAASDGLSFVERCAHAETTSYLPDDILTKVDIASMAYGLETRAPLLDHVLAEFVGRLPLSLKMERMQMKVALKRCLAGRVPHENLYRAKMGFGVPLDHWFRGQLKNLWEETILSPRALERGYFRPEAIRRLVSEHERKRVDHQSRLFALLMLEYWHRLYIDPPAGAELEAPSAPAFALAD